MNNSKSNNCNGGKFFGAVSKNCKTVIVGKSKNEVRQKIHHKHITKNNIAMFECHPKGENTIVKKPIHRTRFRLMARHHAVLKNACLTFLED